MKRPSNLEEIVKYIKNWMAEYDPLILYKKIAIVSIHPSNQKYQTRFELLLAILTSISNEEYKNNELNHDIFKNFISKFKKDTDSLFFTVEDSVPFSQLKLIPYFFERMKYFFFYGQTERTYELLRIVEKLYIYKTDEHHPELIFIKDLFKQVLKYQTKLLTRLVQIDEAQETLDSEIYLPSLRFFKEFEDLIMIKEEEILDIRFFLKMGDNQGELVKNFEALLYGSFFKKIYLKFSELEYSLILPPIQIELLFKIFEEVVRKSGNNKVLEDLIQNNVRKIFEEIAQYFFRSSDLIEEILTNKHESISDNVDVIILYENNLVLIKIADLFSDRKLSTRITECHENLDEILQTLKSESKLYLKLFRSYVYEVPVDELRIFRIILYESIDLSPATFMFSFETNAQMTVFSLIDLIAIFELTSKPLSFFKFLEEKYNTVRLLTFDQIDIFAAFHTNNESLPSFGVDFIALNPHMWSNFYNRYLYNKHQDSIYELIEQEFPNKFNKITKWKENKDIYECIDTRTLHSAMIIKHENKLLWIFIPEYQQPLILEDLEFLIRVIAPLYADYINRIIDDFKTLIRSYTSSHRHAISLIPTKICPKNPYFARFEDSYSQVTEENPIIAKSFLNRQFKLIMIIFNDYELWGDKFIDSKNNDNCKYAIKQLIYSIIEYFEPNLSEQDVNNKTEDFINNCFEDGERDYFLDSVPTGNPEIKKYSPYLKLNPTDQERVIKEVESYLREKEFNQKLLTPEESKEFFKEVYKVFYEKFKDLLSQFDMSLLFYAFKQIELIEGQRYILRIEAGMRSLSQIDDEYRNDFQKKYDEISKLSSVQRFIVENILNFGIKGNKKINNIDYGYIQALTSYLISISQLSDFTHAQVIEYTVNIKNFYNFDEVRSNSLFDYDTFKEVELKSRLEGTRDFYKNLKSITQEENGTKIPLLKERIMIKNLDNAFHSQFSFGFIKMMRVLWTLSSLKYVSKDVSMFPIIMINKGDLIDHVQIEYNSNYENRPDYSDNLNREIKLQEIQSILDFLSLDFNSYQDEEMLLYLRLMKKRNRLTICPLLQLNSQILFGKECCNVAFQLWKKYIFGGIFPYKIDNKSKVKIALDELHSYQDKIFEEACGDIAKETLGEKNYIVRLKKFDRISPQLPKLPDCGEIDLLTVNPKTKTCFILDAKNYNLKLTPYDIKNEINKFLTSEKSNLKKLEKKEKFVRKHINLFFNYFKIDDRQNWIFKKGFVIKENFPSAHIKELDVDFVFQSELKSYLKRES